MSGKILLLDPSTTHRILLKVRLQSVGFDVIGCASSEDAKIALAEGKPDLLIAAMGTGFPAIREFCAAFRLGFETSHIPILAFGASDKRKRTDWLAAGADDALDQSTSDAHLFARIRSLLRMHTGERPLGFVTERALGFSEHSDGFGRPARVLILTHIPIRARALVQALETGGRFIVSCLDPAQPFPQNAPPPDVLLIDAREGQDPLGQGKALRLITELRSRADTRSAEQLVITPEDGSAIAALALDLGASDTVSGDASHDEITLRIGKLHYRKQKLERLRATLRNGVEAALTDPLTGLHNRRYAEPHIQAIAEHARENATTYAILAIDVDHFKRINDTYGHAVGDQALVSIAALLKQGTRSNDLVARFGGEEFVVVMPEADLKSAEAMAERLRDRIESTPIYAELAGGAIGMTVSIGVALGGTLGDRLSSPLERADAALYRSKLAGRNMVSVSALAS